MNLKEFQGKEYFKKYGIAVPKSFLLKNKSSILETSFEKMVLKAQVLHGKRKKSGLVKIIDASCFKEEIESLFDRGNFEVLVEEVLEIEKEFYLSLTIDIIASEIICLFSENGGIDIEDVDENKIVKFFIKDLENIDLNNNIKEMIRKLYGLMKEIDAELIEINPLALTKNGLVALDSKIIIDDNSFFRHPEFLEIKKSQLKGIEKDAFSKGLQYVELDGNTGVIGNGAGLVMSTLDMLKLNGINPGNFLDVGGGANSEKMKIALETVMKKSPEKILINIFGGITRCDEIAKGIVEYKKENEIKIPIFVRLVGSKSEEAKNILEKNGINHFETLEETIEKMV